MTMSLPSVASGRRGGRVPVALVALAQMCVAATLAAPLAAQDRRPGPALEPPPAVCAPVPRATEPDPQARTQAQELASAARQSVILGDLDQARSLLLRAVQLDPTAPNVPYYLARVLDDQGEREQALAEYCRTIALGAPRDEAAFARERIRVLTDDEEPQIPDDAIADRRRISDDAIAGSPRIPDDATVEAPRIPDDATAEPLRIPDDATLEELRTPDDAIAPSRSTGSPRRQSARGGASPTAALTLGMLIPGLGQYYSGKPVRGTVVASLAMGALASGFFVQKRSVDCLEPVSGGCLPDDIARVKVSRPYLTAGIAVAGSVALLGALDAYFGAREQREARRFTEAQGPHVEGPSISSRDGVAELSFFTIRMR